MGEPAAGPTSQREGGPSSPAPTADGFSTPDRTPAASSRGENDSTPRSEQPSVPDAISATLLTQLHPLDPEPSYFSPKPLRLYSSPIPRSPAAGSSDPSPSASTSTSAASLTAAATAATQPPAEERPNARSQHPARPLIHRDISSASTASNVTVRANSVDPTHPQALPPRRDGPVYPNQSYAALHLQQHPIAHVPPIVRSRTTHPHPAHSTANSLSSLAMFGISDDHYRDIIESGARTVGNSPISSPGLFDPIHRRSQNLEQPDDGLYSTPWLHHTHRQAPKETHIADVQADPVSGRKIVNQYEIIDELGRGVHGKVKLGKELGNGRYVAIKIVDRYSKRRRLGKNTSHEDKIKREIAILKKARHPNIVSLLEVIDDPAKKKVYIVLEHVELGEVKWRTEGAKEICLVEWRRFKRESQGIFDNETAAVEDERIVRVAHQKLARQQRRLAKEANQRYKNSAFNDPWSLEFGIESEDDYSDAGLNPEASNYYDYNRNSGRAQFNDRYAASNQPEANMETAFRSSTPERNSGSSGSDPTTEADGHTRGASNTESHRGRTASVAESSSSHRTDREEEEIPEHFHWVPLMTFHAAKEAFKDTVLGIEYLHYQNVIHRDIKPANLLVTKEHRIKISDFGVSYLGRSKTEDNQGDHSESDNQEVDEAIELAKTVGTPAFYAPELCRNETDEDTPVIDGAIDVWALGVTLYCLIYGRVPFHDTNTFTLMRVISEAEPYISRYRLKPVAEQSSSRPSSHGRNSQPILSSKRAQHDLEYEEVDENLRDLLRRLLIKDARYRITIPEIKRHPWVLSGIPNYDAWVEETDPSRSYDGRRIEISKDDMEQAVVPIGLVERIRKKAGEIFSKPFNRTSGSRRRAQSSAANQEGPPPISTNSSSSTISQDGRRGSLAPGAILEVLGRSREAEHPLSHSVTASPEAKDITRYFESPHSRTASPAQSADGNRPHSSVHTIRQTELLPGSSHSPNFPPALPGTPTALESPGGSQLGGLFGGLPRRVVNSMRSRDKLRPPKEHFRAKSTDRLMGGDDDAHGAPSLAISNTTASGHVDQPDALKDLSPIVRESSPSYSESFSQGAFDTNSRQSSRSSLSSRLHRNWAAANEGEGGSTLPLSPDLRPQYAQAHRTGVQAAQEFNPARRPSHPVPLVHKKSDHRFTRSKDEHVQYNIPEPSWSRDRPTSATYPRPPSSLCQAVSPSGSSGENRFRYQKVEDYLNNNNVSSENSPVGVQERGLAFSSSEEQFTPMSHSASNPSIPSVASAGSSVPDECPPLTTHFGGMLTTTSADSISGNQFEAPVDDPAGYDGDHAIESEGDDESDDDALFFGKKRQASKPQQDKSTSNAEPTRSNTVPEVNIRRRSARSGSNGTVKKIPPPEEGTGQQNQTLGLPR